MKSSKLSEFYSIVLIGSFNPLIFHPFWMLQKGLISESDVTTKEIVVHDQITRFKIGEWLEFNVNNKRCEFKILSSDCIIPMLDLITGTLNALPETPIISLGINHGAVILLESDDKYYRLGEVLTPLNLWEKDFASPRLRTIAIEDTKSEKFDGTKRCVIIQPANVKDVKNAVDINMNNHYDLDPQRVIEALRILNKNMNNDFLSFDSIVENLLSHIE